MSALAERAKGMVMISILEYFDPHSCLDNLYLIPHISYEYCTNQIVVKNGLPAYSHHDRFPPWWVFVRDDNGGNLSGDKIPP